MSKMNQNSEPNQKVFYSNLILIGLILILLGAIIYGITIYTQDAVSCLSDPIQYVEVLKNYSCQCSEKNLWEGSFSNLTLKF